MTGSLLINRGAVALLACSTLLLAACNDSGSQVDGVGANEPSGTAPAENPADCARISLDIPAERFAEGRENFAVGSQARTRLDENFAVALAEACAEGFMAKKPLIDPRSKEKNTLFIANAPQANVASIRFDNEATWFEGPFFADGRHVQIPGPGAIKEAIYCHTVGATPAEQEASGRCLVD